jgi:hypothetical protein
MKERWDREDDARWRKRAAEIAAEVAKDLPWLAKMHEVARPRKNGFGTGIWKSWRRRRGAGQTAPEKITRADPERINRDMVRAERERLISRGVYGGSGGSGVVKSTLL